MRYLPGTALNPRPRRARRGGSGGLMTYALLGGLAYLLLSRRPATAATSTASANPVAGILQTLLGALTSGLALGPGTPVEFWINPDTQEFQSIPGGTVTPPGPGFRPASQWEIGQYGVFS